MSAQLVEGDLYQCPNAVHYPGGGLRAAHRGPWR
jgi:hypothetical protein